MEKKNKKSFVERPHIDDRGVPTRVIVPEGETDLSIGIPVSLDISQLYAHMPAEFVVSFVAALHAQGLVKAADYFQPGASDRYKAALLMVIRSDFLSIQALAKQEIDRRR